MSGTSAATPSKIQLLTLRIAKISNFHLSSLNPFQAQDNSDCLQSICEKERGHEHVHWLAEDSQTGIGMILLLGIMLRKRASQTIELELSCETYRDYNEHKQNGEQRE